MSALQEITSEEAATLAELTQEMFSLGGEAGKSNRIRIAPSRFNSLELLITQFLNEFAYPVLVGSLLFGAARQDRLSSGTAVQRLKMVGPLPGLRGTDPRRS